MFFLLFIFPIVILTINQFPLAYGKERIETNLEVIYGSYGVPIDYYYNETSHRGTTNNPTISAPGCPKSIDGIPWIYYGIPKRCFLAGHHGPCPVGHKLMITNGTLFGICACECVVDGIQRGDISLDLKINGNFPRYFQCISRNPYANPYGQVFDTEQNVCYEIGYQGPCKKDEILLSTNPQSVECYKTCTRKGVEGSVNYMNKEYGCIPITVTGSGYAAVGGNKCGMGEKYSNILKKCIKNNGFVGVG